MTPSEIALWQELRRNKLGVRFRRQEPIGPYFADFLCKSARLIVEIDGNPHRWDYEGYDDRRDTYLRSKGYRVIRFWGDEVGEHLEYVIDTIKECLADPSLEPERAPHD